MRPTAPQPVSLVDQIEQFLMLDLESKLAQVFLLLKELRKKMSDMQLAIDSLTQDVADETTVDQSVETLLTQLSAQIVTLTAQITGNPAQVRALNALAASMVANKTVLAQAVIDNTPVVPAPIPAPIVGAPATPAQAAVLGIQTGTPLTAEHAQVINNSPLGPVFPNAQTLGPVERNFSLTHAQLAALTPAQIDARVATMTPVDAAAFRSAAQNARNAALRNPGT